MVPKLRNRLGLAEEHQYLHSPTGRILLLLSKDNIKDSGS